MKRVRALEATDALAGKVILVTGGAQGMGLEVARAAALGGAKGLVICDRNASRKSQVEGEIGALGAECLFVACDVARPEEIRIVVEQADAKFGRIDGLVNCVGDTRRGTLETTDVGLWDTLMNVNLRAHFLFTQAVSRVMKRERTRGSIVNICSVQSRGGLTFCMAYATAKAGLVCLTRNNATELGPYGIKVNAVNMGWTVTDNEDVLQRAESGENWVKQADKTSLLGRIARPSDIAHAVVFLLDDRTHTTGSVMDMHTEYVPGMLGGGIGKASDVDASNDE